MRRVRVRVRARGEARCGCQCCASSAVPSLSPPTATLPSSLVLCSVTQRAAGNMMVSPVYACRTEKQSKKWRRSRRMEKGWVACLYSEEEVLAHVQACVRCSDCPSCLPTSQ